MNQPITFRVEGGRAVAVLTDSRGKSSEYAVAVSLGTVTLTKPSGKAYAVAGGGCDCPAAARFKRDCKHRRWVAAFLPLLKGFGVGGGVDVEKQHELMAALSEPFEPHEVKWKPQAVKGNRALMIAYVDARVVMDRLDEVMGLGNWRTSSREVPEGVVCRLEVRLDGEWIGHEDVGGLSEQPDDGDKLKAGYSDALKRAAVRFGVGRYLYRLPHVWCDYDPAKKRPLKDPQLPPWALPKGAKQQPAQPAADEPGPVARKPAAAAANGHAKPEPPTTGVEMATRLRNLEVQMVAKGWCKAGELMKHVAEVASGYEVPEKLEEWDGDLLRWGMDIGREFLDGAKKAAAAKKAS